MPYVLHEINFRKHHCEQASDSIAEKFLAGLS